MLPLVTHIPAAPAPDESVTCEPSVHCRQFDWVSYMDELLAAGGHVLLQRGFLSLTAVFTVLALYKVMLAGFNSRGMLSSGTASEAEPERMGMLIATLVAAGAYAQQCLGAQPELREALPAPHDWILWVAGGGQASFLAGKMLRLH